MIINGIDIDDEELSLEDEKEVEKLLRELADVQVRATVFCSELEKKKEDVTFEDLSIEESEDINDINNEYSRISESLSQKFKNNSIKSTIQKLKENSGYENMVSVYLNQLIREMKGISKSAKTIIDEANLRKQAQLAIAEQNKKQEQANEKKLAQEQAEREAQEKQALMQVQADKKSQEKTSD